MTKLAHRGACHRNAKDSIENYNISRSGYLLKFHRILRLPRKVTLQPHQMLRLPRKMMRIIDCRRIWNVIYNAQSNRHRPPTSPNTAPTTQNDSHDWSSSHMKRHLQCAEQQALPSNLTKYCACHAKWLSWLIFVTCETSFTMRGATGIALQPHQILRLPRKSALQNLSKILRERLKRQFQCAADSTMIRTWSEHDPTMIRTWSEHELVISHPPVRRGYFSRFGDAFCIENYNISRSGYLLKFHRILRLPRKVTLQPHQMLLLPRKMMCIIDCRRIWNVIYNAQSNRHRPPTSPNTAPATQNDSHDWSSSHMKRHLQCAEQQALPSNLTKYCACHAKWLSWLIFVTYETSFTMRGATGITLQPHQILRLPRKSALQNLSKILRERLKRQFQCAADSTMIQPWSEHDPTMIRTWSEHELVISHPPVRRGYFSRFGDAFCIENYNISRSGYLLKFHRILRLPRKVTLRHHQILRLPRKMTLRHHQMLRLPRKVTLRHHQILRLPRKVRLLLNCYWTELLLSCYWAVTKLLLSCYWTVTELLLNWYWTVTELLLNWPVTELLLSCYWTALLLNCYWTVTELNCYCTVTQLLLNWPVTHKLLLSCYWTELLLDCHSTVTELTCYSTVTGLLLNWPVTGLTCYWPVTELSCYSAVTELLLCTATWTVTVLDSLHF